MSCRFVMGLSTDMPRVTSKDLEGLIGGTYDKSATYDARAPELTRALGNLGLGQLGDRNATGISGYADYDVPYEPRALDVIVDESIRAVFEQSIADAAAVSRRIGFIAPTVEELGQVVDFASLAESYRLEEEARNMPQLVLAPANLSVAQAKELFSHLRQDATIPNNPLEVRDDHDGLVISPLVERRWPTLWAQITAPDSHLFALAGSEEAWSFRMISSTQTPRTVDVTHDGQDSNGFPVILPINHPTVSEYLMLQAMLIQSGHTPIDSSAWRFRTWLAGIYKYTGGVVGMYGHFNEGIVSLGGSLGPEKWGIRSVKDADFYA